MHGCFWEKIMKPGWIAVAASCLFAMVGCGADSHEALIQQTATLLEQAANQVGNIKDEVKKALDLAGGDKKLLATSDEIAKSLEKAGKEAEALKDTGQKLAKVKQEADDFRGSISKKQQADNAEKHNDKLVSAIERLDEEKKALQKLFKALEGLNAEAARPLRDKIREADGQFESLIRQR